MILLRLMAGSDLSLLKERLRVFTNANMVELERNLPSVTIFLLRFKDTTYFNFCKCMVSLI